MKLPMMFELFSCAGETNRKMQAYEGGALLRRFAEEGGITFEKRKYCSVP